MQLDHIFIFSNRGKEAQTLVDFGFMEGSGKTHQGIGTVNRRVFFDNFYLEILWVEKEEEARANSKLGIWERSIFSESGYSRSGICLKNSPDTDVLFKDAIKWQPAFLPSHETVDILTDKNLPWIFRFPKREPRNLDENRNHPNGIRQLTGAELQLKTSSLCSDLQELGIAKLIPSDKEQLMLQFDGGQQGKSKYFAELNLRIVY